jgi:hypothetical protein
MATKLFEGSTQGRMLICEYLCSEKFSVGSSFVEGPSNCCYACDLAHYTLYNHAYFVGIVFVVSRLSTKTVRIRHLKNFLLYGSRSV